MFLEHVIVHTFNKVQYILNQTFEQSTASGQRLYFNIKVQKGEKLRMDWYYNSKKLLAIKFNRQAYVPYTSM